jgi:hypothetical protein
MKARRWTNWLNVARGTRGAEIAETAMILPLLFVFIMAVFWFGQAFRIYGTITQAARQGARAAVAPACATCAASNDPSANAWAAVQSTMQAAHLDPTLLKQPTPLPPLCPCSSSASSTSCTGGGAVSCDSGETNICVQGVSRTEGNPPTESNVELSAPAQGGAGECGISVSFQYPYSFWLPFSTLNKETIQLRAQAEMRAESQ